MEDRGEKMPPAASPPRGVWGKGPPTPANPPPAQAPGSEPPPDDGKNADGKDSAAKETASSAPPPAVNAWSRGAPGTAKAAAAPPSQAAASTEEVAAAAPPVKKSWADMAKSNQPPPPLAAAPEVEPGMGVTRPEGKKGSSGGSQPTHQQQHEPPSPAREAGGAPTSTPHSEAQTPSQPVAERGPALTEEVDKEHEAARQSFERMIDGCMSEGILERRVRGLQNPGNMCFVNAVVQCLAACRPLFRFIAGAKDYPIPEKMVTMRELVTVFSEMMDEFVELGDGAKESKRGGGAHKGAIRGSAMASVVNKFVPEDPVRQMGGKGRQEDAQEFLGFVLNALHDELATGEAPQGVGAGVEDGGGNVQEEVMEEEEDNDGWLQVGGKGGAKKTSVRKMRTERTLVTAVFGGEVETMIRYSGTWASAVREPWMWLSLDIRPGEIKTLDDALTHFLKKEELSMQDDKKASKNVRVTSWPEVLVVHLKRFHFEDQRGQKVNKKIAYPESFPVQVEVSGRASTSAVMRDYALSSVVLHHGKQLTEGHYTAMVRHESERGDAWVKVDDESTSSITLDDVLGQQQLAYLLFYKHERKATT